MDVSDFFLFLRSGEGKGQSEAPGGRQGSVFIENPRRGGGPQEGGPEGVCGEFGAGGAIFFRAEIPTKNFRNTPSTAGNSMTGSESSGTTSEKKERGREFWKCSGSFKCLEL